MLLTSLALWGYHPPLSSRQHLRLQFSEGRPGTSEPLIVTGAPGVGDFLFVRYLDARTLTLGYDQWGIGGPVSGPLAFTPGATHRLELDLPSLQRVSGNPLQPPNQLRIVFDGQTVLHATIEPRLRRPTELWLGRNPIGGSACGPQFSGLILDTRGLSLKGGVRELQSPLDRLQGWLNFGRWQVFMIVLVSVAIGWGWLRCRTALAGDSRGLIQTGACALRRHTAFALTSLGCVAIFIAMISGGSGSLIFPDNFGRFYDHQALSLLGGRLNVPPEAIANEAFVFEGKYFGYFGPVPALLRFPLVVFGLWFGMVTRIAMTLSFLAALLGGYLVLCETFRMHGEKRHPPGWAAVLFALNVGLGSTLLFLGSRAYLYHEAIIVGAALAIWSCWCALRYLRVPAGRWWLGAVVCGMLSVHARPPTGLFALTFCACAAVVLAWQQRRLMKVACRHLMIGGAAAVGVLSFNGLSYLKFKTFEGSPLRLSVQYDARRLAHIEGRQFHAANVPFNFYTYILAPNLLIQPRFPYVYLNVSKPDAAFPLAKIDYADRTLALPYAMTGLCLLALIGVASILPSTRLIRLAVILWGVAVIPMALALFAAVAVSHRYTADFHPPLVLGAAFGIAAVVRSARPARVGLVTVLVCATVWSISLNGAIAMHYLGADVWGVPDGTRERYESFRGRVDNWFRS